MVKRTVNGKSVEELYEMLNSGQELPPNTCRDYTKNPPFYECDNEKQHLELSDVTVVSFGGQVEAVDADTE